MIYLNNAATSFPKPIRVVEAVRSLLDQPPYHHARAGFQRGSDDAVTECRRLLCELFHADDPNRILFSAGATASLNLIINGLCLRGRHVVTTAMEHNSVLRPLKTLERRGALEVSIVDCDSLGAVCPEDIAKAIRPDTAAVIVNHCSNVTGAVNDLAAIGEIVGGTDSLFVVDASQSAGMETIDVKTMRIDALAFTGHKALFGLQGIGGMYLSERFRPPPLIVGGTGVRSENLYQPEELPLLYEAGTQNIVGIVSLLEGVRFIRDRGIAALREQRLRATEAIRAHLTRRRGVRLYPPRNAPPTALFSFNIDGIAPEDLGYILEHSFDICTRSGLHCAPLIHRCMGSYPAGSVRVSPSCFTTDDEIAAFGRAIDAICASLWKKT